MSDLLRHQTDNDHEDGETPFGRWSSVDQLQVALEAQQGLTNPEAVRLALGLSLSPERGPAFIPLRWLDGARLVVPTSGGVPLRAGRLKVMPVFTDAEAVRAWLPAGRRGEHPCFGPPPDGLTVVPTTGLSELRETAGAVMVFLNPAGPGGYQIDPEDGALDVVEWAGPGAVAGGDCATASDRPRPQGLSVPPPALELIGPAGRVRLRERIRSVIEQASVLAAAGREPEALGLLAGADRLGELLGDYLHRAEMMMAAARILEGAGRPHAAGRLAHYAVLAASLCARGRLEMEAVQLRARLQ